MVDEHILYNSFREEEDLSKNSQYFYGSETYDDYMFRNPQSLPRLGYLARKAIVHYVGAIYNPHRTDFWIEELFRLHIHRIIKDKIFYRRKEHDWIYIDNFFKKIASDLFKIDLKFDEQIVEVGYSPGFAPPGTNEFPI
jgi:hypothetical protein